MDQISKAAEFIADLRFTLRQIPQIPETFRPHTLVSGYAVQEGVVDRLLKKNGGHAAGYKVACTNKLAQQLPSIEIVDTRYIVWTEVPLPCLISDNGCNSGWIRGKATEAWRNIDLASGRECKTRMIKLFYSRSACPVFCGA